MVAPRTGRRVGAAPVAAARVPARAASWSTRAAQGWTLEGELGGARPERRGRRRDAAASTRTRSGRLWSALECPHAGDVLVSATPGYEFVDWGGADHVGGGSHGSLHRGDSVGVLLLCGVDAPEREQWSLADVTPLVLDHFRVR